MGKIYGKRWEIVCNIGEGGQAHTFRVRDLNDRSENWILKRLKNNNRIERFRREIEVLKTLYHPNIPNVEDYSIEGEKYYVMPYLGKDLKNFTEQKPLSGEDVDIILLMISQIVAAVSAAHTAGVFHRDIKPNNVIVSDDATAAYLIDFGICQYTDGALASLTRTDEPFGNQAFSAPECNLGSTLEPAAPSDVYSLGKLIYWIISHGNNIFREIISDEKLDLIIFEDSLVKSYFIPFLFGTIKEEPMQRWSCKDLLEEIENVRKLISRLRDYQEQGYIVVKDTIGVDNAFNKTSSKSATMAPQGNSPGKHEIAASFQVRTTSDVILEAIDLALGKTAGSGEAELDFVEDENGLPHPDRIIETFPIKALSEPSVSRVQSIVRPILRRGQQYWLVLSTVQRGCRVALWGARPKSEPRPALNAHRFDNGNWEPQFSPRGPGYALRVLGIDRKYKPCSFR